MHHGKLRQQSRAGTLTLVDPPRELFCRSVFTQTEERAGVCPQVDSNHLHSSEAYRGWRRISGKRRSGAGITLIELMVTVAIVALLAAVAYPSYQTQIRKARRTVAKTALVDIASRQEQFFQDNKTYTDNLTRLGYSADPFYLDKDGNTTASDSSSRMYQIDITAAETSTFAVSGIPQLSQTSDSCGTLTLNQAGDKGSGGPVSECW